MGSVVIASVHGTFISFSVHGAVDGFLMTVLFSVVRHVTVDNSQCGIMWSLTNLAVGLGQLTGLPVAGKKLNSGM